MGSGKAKGKDREYQIYCRDILTACRQSGFVAYYGDGIDVGIFGPGDTSITFDILLQDDGGRLLAVECKRWASAVPQLFVLGFAKEVEWLREVTNKEVAGIFCTTKNVQKGAVKHAGILDNIEVLICKQGQSPYAFCVLFKTYDATRKKIIDEGLASITEHGAGTDSVSVQVVASHCDHGTGNC